MIPVEWPDDGFRITEIGKYRWRVNPAHEARSIRGVRNRWKRESEVLAA